MINGKYKVKVCGMTDGANIREVEAAGADIIGFIFCEGSPRNVREVPDYLPLRSERAGVFVDAGISFILEACGRFGLDYVQLHGHESPAFCKALISNGISADRIIKVVHFSGGSTQNDKQSPHSNSMATDGSSQMSCSNNAAEKGGESRRPENGHTEPECQKGEMAQNQHLTSTREVVPTKYGMKTRNRELAESMESLCRDYYGVCGQFLFDAKVGNSLMGGTGQTFDWSILDGYGGPLPFLLSGGIAPGMADELSGFQHPRLGGYDLNSRFEIRPGLKDAKAVAKFIMELDLASQLAKSNRGGWTQRDKTRTYSYGKIYSKIENEQDK